jgi:hypothetical protein
VSIFVGTFDEFLCSRDILRWGRRVELLRGEKLLAKSRGNKLVLG